MDAPVAILFRAMPGGAHERTTTNLCEKNELPHFSTALNARKMYIESQSNSPTERLSPRSSEHAAALAKFIQRKTADNPEFFCLRIIRNLPPGLVLITTFNDDERTFFAERLDHLFADGPVVEGEPIYDADTYELFHETVHSLVQSALLAPDPFMPEQHPLYTDQGRDFFQPTPGEIINVTCH